MASPGKELLIVSVTPQNLERDALWFSEHQMAIRKARSIHAWWQDNSVFVQQDLEIKPSYLARRLAELGYERAPTVRGKGLFAVRGGIIEVWPVNTDQAWLIEFHGNAVSALIGREVSAETFKPRALPNRGSVEKLAAGSFVVHVDHGIGIWRGQSRGYFVVEYAPPAPGLMPDRLFVPVGQEERLTPYVGFETPRLHRLGGALWTRTRKKIKEEALILARQLLSLYAARHHAQRAPYQPDADLADELRATFPYQETDDQVRAEEDILRDLALPRPMDRILCGDVGFGKTEVAVRTALAAITSGRQVALLSPTTVLAVQHEDTFLARMAGLGVRVRALSRLTPAQDQSRIREELACGAVDCLIGTHRILSRDIQFKNLGLVIIDEEQRFGVKQKERFKELRSEVDILSLSATPIPRTLSLAIAKLRDISILSTPPHNRLSIKTAVLPHTARTIREAIRFELARGGQVYVLHNRIETIGAVKESLESMLALKKTDRDGDGRAAQKRSAPRIGVIHGRMDEQRLIQTMDQFRRRETDILIATTIIENGLDISSANTLIVDDATRLGLAQAHQLRGRVGRADTQAFAYFLYRPRQMSQRAVERLEALQEYADLGAGYDIAMRDLEIRGAGNILGREQSGAINKVGFNLYCQMLAEAVEETKNSSNKV